MKLFFLLIFFVLASSSCTAESNKNIKYTGDEISVKFKKIQEFSVDYEVDGGGPVFDKKIKIYKVDSQGKCAIVSKIDGDSGVYGTEAILYFSKSKVFDGYRLNYSYSFVDGENSKKRDKLNYLDPLVKIEKNELEKEFNNYRINFSKETLKECG